MSSNFFLLVIGETISIENQQICIPYPCCTYHVWEHMILLTLTLTYTHTHTHTLICTHRHKLTHRLNILTQAHTHFLAQALQPPSCLSPLTLRLGPSHPPSLYIVLYITLHCYRKSRNPRNVPFCLVVHSTLLWDLVYPHCFGHLS